MENDGASNKKLLVAWNDKECREICRWLVRPGSHWGGSPQNKLRDMWTHGMTLASAYMLHYLSAVWSQLQMIGRSLR